MIIEGILQALIMRVGWSEVQGSGHGEAEQSGYLIGDHSPAHRVELVHSQNVQQGRAGDKVLGAVRQELCECLDARIDDHGVVRQWQ